MLGEDGQLIQQVCCGDLHAFEALYDKYKAQIYRAALAITDDPGAAEDILQDCFLRLHANIDRLDGSVPISPWLHRVAVNLAYNYVARQKRRSSPLELVMDTLVAGSNVSPDRHVESRETRDAVQSAIDSLSFSHRAVVTLYYLSDFSLEEIAYILDCPIGTVKSRLHYARNKMRSHLTAQLGIVGEAAA